MDKVRDKSLIEDMVRRHGIPLAQAQQAATEIPAVIRAGLIRDGAVTVINLGIFRLKPIAARVGFNPQTRERIAIPAHPRVAFTPGKALRELIAQGHLHRIRPAAGSTPGLPGMALPVTAHPAPEQSLPAAPGPDQGRAMLARPAGDTTEASSTGPAATKPAASRAPTVQAPHNPPQRNIPIGAFTLLVVAGIAIWLLAPPTETDRATGPGLAPTPAHTLPAPTGNHPAPALGAPFTEVLAAAPLPEIATAGAQPTSRVATDADRVMLVSGNPDPTHLSVAKVSNAVFFAGRPHAIVSGDSLWRLARTHYNDALLWPHIYQANTGTIDDPDRLHVGLTIVLPSLHASPDDLSEIDRRSIAEGYYLYYLHYQKIGHDQTPYALLAARHYHPALVDKIEASH